MTFQQKEKKVKKKVHEIWSWLLSTWSVYWKLPVPKSHQCFWGTEKQEKSTHLECRGLLWLPCELTGSLWNMTGLSAWAIPMLLASATSPDSLPPKGRVWITQQCQQTLTASHVLCLWHGTSFELCVTCVQRKASLSWNTDPQIILGVLLQKEL